MKKFFIPIAISAIVLVGLLPGGCAKSGPTALSRVPLSPARSLVGTWKTSSAVTVFFKTDFCDTLALVASEPWSVTFIITAGSDQNHVNVLMDFTAGTPTYSTLDPSCAYFTPEVSPIGFTGTISSSALTLYSGSEKVGNFNFTTDIMTGTLFYTWSAVYTQEDSTATNALSLTRQ